MKKNVNVLWPGQWIRFIRYEDCRWKEVIGRIEGINEKEELKVSVGATKTLWIKVEHVVASYPRFMVFPIPGKKNEF